MKIPFIHLHNHSCLSPDGLDLPETMFQKAKNLGFEALSLTEHGNLSSAVRAYVASKDTNVKWIAGTEIYFVHEETKYHLTILASGQNGWKNLVKLNNLAKRNGNYNTLSQLKDCKEDLFVLSGCISSPFNRLEFSKAVELGLEFKRIFGERFMIEAMSVMNTNDNILRSEQLAKELDLPIVITNDCHFVEKGFDDVQQIKNILLKGFSYDSRKLWLCTPEELLERFPTEEHDKVIGWMKNAYDLGSKLAMPVFSEEVKLPHVENAEEVFKEKVYNALSLYKGNMEEAKKRIDYEVKIIVEKGFATYLLICADVVNNAKEAGIMIGAGRGSGVGSLVVYLLGITDIDPLKYGLLFERFLNPKRTGLIDLDIDTPSSAKQHILDYCREKYGAVGVTTVTDFSEKNTLRDLSHYFGLPKKQENDLCEKGYNSDVYKEVCLSHDGFDKAYLGLFGNVRHNGLHPAGIVLSGGDDEFPILVDKRGNELIAFSEGRKQELTETGFVKFDFLSLQTLDLLQELKETTGVSPPNEPEYNAPEFSLLRQSRNLGVFQLGASSGITDFAMRVQPNCIEDIIAVTSLWRSGTIDSNTHELYLQYRQTGGRKLHPEIDEILKETYGLIVYQETFMNLYAWATDCDFGDADEIRRAIVKFKPDDSKSVAKLEKIEKEFLSGLDKKGVGKELAYNLWHEIVAHSGYSFNKSHASAYSKITWQTLWYKHYYPKHFYASLLNNDTDRTQEAIFEIHNEGMFVQKPDINKSDIYKFLADETEEIIYMPLNVKFVGESGLKEIELNRPFKTVEEFMKRVSKRGLPSRGRASLFLCGAFDKLTDNYEDLQLSYKDLLYLNKANDLLKIIKKVYAKNEIDEFFKYLTGDTDNKEFNIEKIKQIANYKEFMKILSYSVHQDKNKINLKPAELFGIVEKEKDINFLGYVLLTKQDVEAIQKSNSGKYSAGVLIKKELRKNKKDVEYYSCLLYPYENFWTYNTNIEAEIGDKLVIEKTSYGKLLKWKTI